MRYGSVIRQKYVTYLSCSHSGCSKRAVYVVRERQDGVRIPEMNPDRDDRSGPHVDHDCCGHSKHNVTHAYWERDGRPWERL